MATYATDQDLLKYRADILSLGVDSWETQRDEAFSIINRTITARWYTKAAPVMGVDPLITAFDPTLVQTDELNRLECFKVLELAYGYLSKGCQESDGFERLRKLYKGEYGDELDSVLGIGISYDWNGDDEIDVEEVRIQAPRRLSRC